MGVSELECPDCRCPLTPPSQAATGMSCPRCKAWLEFDARCTGGCISCFKTKEAKQEPCCSSGTADPGSQVAETSRGTDLKKNDRGPFNLVISGWKRLIQRLLAVR